MGQLMLHVPKKGTPGGAANHELGEKETTADGSKESTTKRSSSAEKYMDCSKRGGTYGAGGEDSVSESVNRSCRQEGVDLTPPSKQELEGISSSWESLQRVRL